VQQPRRLAGRGQQRCHGEQKDRGVQLKDATGSTCLGLAVHIGTGAARRSPLQRGGELKGGDPGEEAAEQQRQPAHADSIHRKFALPALQGILQVHAVGHLQAIRRTGDQRNVPPPRTDVLHDTRGLPKTEGLNIRSLLPIYAVGIFCGALNLGAVRLAPHLGDLRKTEVLIVQQGNVHLRF